MTAINPSTSYGYALFCDDIRQEINGKITLVGVYGSEMTVYTSLPATIPKLGISANYYEAQGESREDLQLNVYLPEDANGAPSSQFKIPPEMAAQLRSPPIPPGEAADNIRGSLVFSIVFSPITLNQEGVIRVRMARGAQEIKLGGLRIRAQPPSP